MSGITLFFETYKYEATYKYSKIILVVLEVYVQSEIPLKR